MFCFTEDIASNVSPIISKLANMDSSEDHRSEAASVSAPPPVMGYPSPVIVTLTFYFYIFLSGHLQFHKKYF